MPRARHKKPKVNSATSALALLTGLLVLLVAPSPVLLVTAKLN